MTEQPTTTTERTLLFCCFDCHPDRHGEPVRREDLATRLGRHRREHPEHERTSVGYPAPGDSDA
jgi:hypothetical protein